jgi:hypothetical protein
MNKDIYDKMQQYIKQYTMYIYRRETGEKKYEAQFSKAVPGRGSL